MERLKLGTELKLVSCGNEFHAFTTRSLKKLDLAQVLIAMPFKQLKTMLSQLIKLYTCNTF